MNVGIQDRYLIVIIAVTPELIDHRASGFLGLLRQLQPFLYGCAVAGYDEVRHVIAQVGLPHHAVFHVGRRGSAVVVAFFGQPAQLIIDLPHGMEGRIGLDGDVFKGSQRDPVQFGGQGELPADVQICTAAFVRHADDAIGRGRGGGEIELQRVSVQRSLKAFHGEGHIAIIDGFICNGREVDRFLLVREHFFFAVERYEFPVGGIGVGRFAVERPGHLVRAGLSDLAGLVFGKREGQGFAFCLRQGQEEPAIAVHLRGLRCPGRRASLNGGFFPGPCAGLTGAGIAAEKQREDKG